MTDPFSWSINLGRWSGTQVRIHIIFVLFALGNLFDAMLAPATKGRSVAETAAWLVLLLAALAVHELGHAAMAVRLGSEVEEIRLWPLGNLSGPTPSNPNRSTENFLIALAGPATSLGVALIMALILNFGAARLTVSPFGNELGSGGAPLLIGVNEAAKAFSTNWYLGWFGYLNLILFLSNLILALPMDGGRMFRAALVSPLFGQPKDSPAAPLVSRAFEGVLVLAGLYRLFFENKGGGGLTLIFLAIFIELTLRAEARMMEDGGFLDDNVFGYDFSEGYTSLEGSAQKVRPYRESALKRWRRRRADLRRDRRQEQEAIEERRMDEILAKLHSEGRAALSDDEQRFLVRVSSKYKNRSKSRE